MSELGKCPRCRQKDKQLRYNHTLRDKRVVKICAACHAEKKAKSDPTYRMTRTLSTHNSRHGGCVTLGEVLGLLQRQAFKCVYCRSALDIRDASIDHIKPIVGGGEHKIGNISLCCPTCNSSKQHKPLIPWLKSKGYELHRTIKEKL